MEEATLSVFQHDPLPDAKTHIRLLEILHGDFDQQVACKLSVWPIDDAPPYYAISYTWGDPDSTANVTINGKQLVVRQNCEYVLQQAFSSRACQYFWIDAVCINQQSVHEKNYQVAMMGQLYSRAAHVFACVGPHSNDSEFIIETCKRRESLFAEIHSKVGQERLQTTHWHIFLGNAIPEHSWLALRCFFSINTEVKQRLVDAFLSLIKRPYFSRVWVLQELHQAPQLSFCCGTELCSANDMVALSMLVTFWLYEYYGSGRQRIRMNWQALLFRRKSAYRNARTLSLNIGPRFSTLSLVSQPKHFGSCTRSWGSWTVSKALTCEIGCMVYCLL